MRARILALLRDRRGVTALEYGLIGVGVFIAIASTVSSVGTATLGLYQSVVVAFR